jgi:ATP-binding cassette subfamily B protein
LLDKAIPLVRPFRGRTTFIIAHRLATAVRADRILALRQGRIVETGEHGELMARGGYYESLVRSHYGDFLDCPEPD